MVHTTGKSITLDEFFALPDDDQTYEFVNGQAVPKVLLSTMSPNFFHSAITGALFTLLSQWSQNRGRVCIEWALLLRWQDKPWVPVPDLTYISYDRLPKTWVKDEACPVCPDLVIEIISPGQTFGAMTEKSTNYLLAGISCVWVVDSAARSITLFSPDSLPQTYRGDRVIATPLLPALTITPNQVFQQAGLLDN